MCSVVVAKPKCILSDLAGLKTSAAGVPFIKTHPVNKLQCPQGLEHLFALFQISVHAGCEISFDQFDVEKLRLPGNPKLLVANR